MRSVLLGGTLCDARIFDGIAGSLAAPIMLDFRDHDDAGVAAAALLPHVPAGSLGIAFSLGGWILIEMARREPNRFAGIVLISANAHPDNAANAASRLARVAEGRERGLRALLAGEDRLVADMAEACGHDVHHRQARLNSGRPDHRAALAALRMPVMVIAGDADALCPAERYADMAAAGAELHRLPGIGHYVPIEAPDMVVGLIAKRFPEAVR